MAECTKCHWKYSAYSQTKRHSNKYYKFRHTEVQAVNWTVIMDSLHDRREVVMARFFKRQVLLANNSLLHYLLPERRQWHYPQPEKFPTISLNQSSHKEVALIFPALLVEKLHIVSLNQLINCMLWVTGALWFCTVCSCSNIYSKQVIEFIRRTKKQKVTMRRGLYRLKNTVLSCTIQHLSCYMQ